MNEAEWLACTDVRFMLEHLEQHASARKLRLFGAAACRLIAHRKQGKLIHSVIDLIERVAESQATKKEWRGTRAYMRSLMQNGFSSEEKQVGKALWQALWIEETPQLPRWLLAAMVADSVASTNSTLRDQAVRSQLVAILSDLFGNPFRPAPVDHHWLTYNGGTVGNLAQAIDRDRDFGRLPILADALEDAGCTSEDMLLHCRSGATHIRGCWVVDRLVGNE